MGVESCVCERVREGVHTTLTSACSMGSAKGTGVLTVHAARCDGGSARRAQGNGLPACRPMALRLALIRRGVPVQDGRAPQQAGGRGMQRSAERVVIVGLCSWYSFLGGYCTHTHTHTRHTHAHARARTLSVLHVGRSGHYVLRARGSCLRTVTHWGCLCKACGFVWAVSLRAKSLGPSRWVSGVIYRIVSRDGAALDGAARGRVG